MIPAQHQAFIDNAVGILRQDPRICGIALCGSYVTQNMDEYSDLDFMLAVEPESFGQVLDERRALAGKLGSLLSAFPGDHIGVPDLLICLFDAPLIHADFNFIALDKAEDRFNGTAILYDRDGRLTRYYRETGHVYAALDPQWLEDRFWVWVHYAALKIGRGELFEALDMISYLRVAVLGPLLHVEKGGAPRGVRRLEDVAPEYMEQLAGTVPAYERAGCVRALRAEIELYRQLRARYIGQISLRPEAEARAAAYLDDIAGR
jgi:predicted nucleotidyltransferase